MKPVVFFVIDDDEDDRELFEIALKALKKDTIFMGAQDCKEALKMLETQMIRPDYIFLDLNMPSMDGKECLCEIKNNVKLMHIPIIMYTTSTDERDREATIKLGAYQFITKPSRISELTAILEEFAERKFYKSIKK